MRLSDFDFELPPELIAQEPLERRDRSRLLHVDDRGRLGHYLFERLPALLEPGDLLVVNDTKVFPARLTGRRPSGGAVELLLIRRPETNRWEVLARPARKLRLGSKLVFGDGRLEAELVGLDPAVVQLTFDGAWDDVVDELGRTPLPPYIRSDAAETLLRGRYQTVYAARRGSIAAPTAGLHFTEDTFTRLEDRGVAVAPLTHHVGYATFAPMRSDVVGEHRMGVERYEIRPATTELIRSARRVVAVGTTTVRALESAVRHEFTPGWHETDLFITPGFEFRAVSGMVTNFHLPKSTLILLVSALGGSDLVRRAYAEAIAERYRFYSFGDAMILLPGLHGAR